MWWTPCCVLQIPFCERFTAPLSWDCHLKVVLSCQVPLRTVSAAESPHPKALPSLGSLSDWGRQEYKSPDVLTQLRTTQKGHFGSKAPQV